MNTNQQKYTAFMESVCKEFNCPDMLPALNAGFKAFCEASYGFDTEVSFPDGVVHKHQFDPTLRNYTKNEFAHALKEWRDDGFAPKFNTPMKRTNNDNGMSMTMIPRKSEFDHDNWYKTKTSSHIPSAIQNVVNKAIVENNWDMTISRDKTSYILYDDNPEIVNTVTQYMKSLPFWKPVEKYGETMGHGLTSAGTHIESGDTYVYYVFNYKGHARDATPEEIEERKRKYNI
jgi:hypothetical protein